MPPAEIYRLITLVAAGLFGACIGSFLNVVIYRLPLGMKVNEPKRSFCPKCEKQIPTSQNLPLLSWLLLGGKCSQCRAPIPFRYFFVELLVAVGFVTLFWFFPPWEAGVLSIFFALLVAATFIDLDHFIIPHSINFTGLAVGLIGSALVPSLHASATWWQGLLWSFVGAAVGFGLIYAVVELGKLAFGRRKLAYEEPEVWSITQPNEEEPPVFTIEGEGTSWWDLFVRKTDRLIVECDRCCLNGEDHGAVEAHFYEDRVEVPSKEINLSLEDLESAKGEARSVVIPREAMGFGDVLFLMMIGSFIGWKGCLFTVAAASMLGAILGYGGRLIGKGEWSGCIPFGPYLAAGALIWIACGPELLKGYMDFVGGALGR